MNKENRVREQNRVRAKKRRRVKKILQNEFSAYDEFDSESIDETPNIPEATQKVNEPVNEVRDEGVFIEDHFYHEAVSRSASSEEDQSSSSEEIIVDDSSVYEETSDSLDEDEDNPNDVDINSDIDKLRDWAIDCKIYHNHLDKLLEILRARLLPTLPKSSKTFLRTNDACYEIEDMEDSAGGIGQFVYFGIENGLRDCINKNLHKDKRIELQVHADGMPLTISGTNHSWVLSGKVHFDPDIYKPFQIAIFYGQNKPKSSDVFLDSFVKEINLLTEYGILISGTRLDVKVKCVIADTPARAFLKETVGHVGIFACERCTIHGVKVNGSTVYPSVTAEKRTDDSFRNFDQPDHHHAPSAFLRLIPFINMVAFFVLDFMHLCCQGVMKKLIEYWMSGNLNFKLSSQSKIELTNRLRRIRNQIPREFQRKIRAPKHFLKWKATEFRFFLLYCGPVVLKGLLKDQLYTHFLLLHAACRILCCRSVCLKYSKQAKEYLTSFFIAISDFYGENAQILNVHHLIHLADDVMFLRCSLSYITAFPFESFLGRIKKCLRTANRPLAQLCRRLYEEKQLKNNKPKLPPVVEILKRSREDRIKEIKYKQVIITTASPNNMMLLNDQSIVQVQQIRGNPETPELLELEATVWEKKKPLFTYPCDSTKLQMWELKDKPSKKVIAFPVTSISNKLVKLSVLKENGREKFYVIGMLH